MKKNLSLIPMCLTITNGRFLSKGDRSPAMFSSKGDCSPAPRTSNMFSSNGDCSPSARSSSSNVSRQRRLKHGKSFNVDKSLNVRKQPKRRESSVLSTSSVRKNKNKQDGNTMVNQYAVQKTLGKGTFATVKQCKDSKTGILYALKQMNKEKLLNMRELSGKTAYDSVVEEMKVLQRLAHPNIMWLYEIIDDPKKKELYLVTEFYSRGSLLDKVNERNNKYKHYNGECRIEGRF